MLRKIGRVLVWVVGLLVGLVLLLVGSVLVDGLAGPQRLDALSNTLIPGVNGQPDVRAYVARPTGAGPFPVVMMIHEFFGLNESIISKADGLAQEGYLVVAPDTFRGSTTSWIPRAIYQVVSTPAEQINLDLDSVYAWLEMQPDVDISRVGIGGFCFGGRASLGYSLHNNRLAATVIFYGSPIVEPETLKALPGPVLGIFGEEDSSISLEEVKAFDAGLEKAGIIHQISIYEGQPHAFVQDMEAVRSDPVQAEAWAEMLAFLELHLKNGSLAAVPSTEPSAFVLPFDWQYYTLLVYEHAFGMHSH